MEIALVGIFPYSDWNRDLLRKSPYLVKIRQNTDHNNILSLRLFRKLCGQSLKQSFLHYISRTTLLVANRASTSQKNEVFIKDFFSKCDQRLKREKTNYLKEQWYPHINYASVYSKGPVKVDIRRTQTVNKTVRKYPNDKIQFTLFCLLHGRWVYGFFPISPEMWHIERTDAFSAVSF